MATVLALDIGGSTVKSSVVSKGSSAEEPVMGEVNRTPVGRSTFESLLETVKGVLKSAPAVDAVAVSTTGTLSKDKRILRSRAFQGYEGVSWEEQIAKLGYSGPVEVVNDGHAVATAENADVGDAYRDNTAHFVIGTGVGGGAYVNGQLLTGTAGYAGAFGHVKVASGRGSIPCACGTDGCVEKYAAAGAIKGALKDAGLDATDLLPQGLSSDDLARVGNVYIEAGWWLGRAIGSVINVLNPSVVTIGGGVIDADTELAERLELPRGPYLESAVGEGSASSLKNAAAVVSIRKSRHGNTAGIMGAAIMALRIID